MEQNFLLFCDDAKDAFAPSPIPEVPTFMMIDNQYYEWYFERFKIKLDKSRVLPVLQALQGHPKLGKLWEWHINNILMSTALGFKHITHNCTIYQTVFKTHKVLLLRQVDNLVIQCENKSTARETFLIIGLKNKDKPPFAYLEKIVDFNGVDIDQSNTRIMISCENYINRMF